MQTNFEKYFEKRILKEFKELDTTKKNINKNVKKIREIKIQKKNNCRKKQVCSKFYSFKLIHFSFLQQFLYDFPHQKNYQNKSRMKKKNEKRKRK